jgi:hypothetical protein
MNLKQLIKEGDENFDEKFADYFYRYVAIPKFDNILPEERKTKEQMFEGYKSYIRQNKLKLIDWIIEEMPKEIEKPKDKCINVENHLFGNCFQCVKIDGSNQYRQQMLSKLEEVKKELKQ